MTLSDSFGTDFDKSIFWIQRANPSRKYHILIYGQQQRNSMFKTSLYLFNISLVLVQILFSFDLNLALV